MTKTVNREMLIAQLESVLPGLSAKDNLEQSSCFVFMEDKRVVTFNDEIACSQDCDIGMTGAIHSGALLEILRKLPEDELEFEAADNVLKITGKRKVIDVTREAEISLPIDAVEKPAKWRELDDKFLEAISMVQHCASSDDQKFSLMCVHIAPEFVEASDNSQVTRVKVDTKVKQEILVRRDSIKHIVTLGMNQVSETETWIHFKNPAGLVLSCRRFVDEYYDFSELLATKGESIQLPKGLAAAAERAAVFVTSTDAEKAQIKIELRPGKLRVQGKGVSGHYRETKQLAYEGPELAFLIAPQLLADITKRYNEAQITAGRLKVKSGTATYVACLSEVSEAAQ